MGSLISETPFSEVAATLEILEHNGVRRDDLRKFRAASPYVQHHMASMFCDADQPTSISTMSRGSMVIDQIFYLMVDYDLTLEQMIAAGHYDIHDPKITVQNFPIERKGLVKFVAGYLHFNYDISSEDAIKQIKAVGWKLAKIEHLLALGAMSPDDQRKFPIIALGTQVYLDHDGSKRHLEIDDLARFKIDWPKRCRFLVILEL